jgi:hypothetical protein
VRPVELVKVGHSCIGATNGSGKWIRYSALEADDQRR